MTKDSIGSNFLSVERAATSSCAEHAMEHSADSAAKSPKAEWRTFGKPRWLKRWLRLRSLLLDSSWHRSNCLLADGLLRQSTLLCRKKRTRCPCETFDRCGWHWQDYIILELMLDIFCHFFPARPGEEERYMISTFSHSQSDANSNVVYRARTCHTACSYHVASLRNKLRALKTKEHEMKQRWRPKILLIQDEINLVPAALENMMLYCSTRARQDEGLDPGSYFHAGELMGHIPILLIAGDFLQIKPTNQISLADSLEELVRKRPDNVQTEHYAAQAALMSMETMIHLKKSKRFLEFEFARNHNSHARIHSCTCTSCARA